MYKIRTIFTLIFVSLQRGRSDQIKNTDCCHESVLLNISLPNCADIRCSTFSENTADNGGTYSPLDNEGTTSLPDERPSELTTNYNNISPSASVFTEPPLPFVCPSDWFNAMFYWFDDQSIKIDTRYGDCFHFSPYYECKVVRRSKAAGNLYIKCPCGNTECCPPGNLIFDKDEEIGSFWECTLKTEKLDYWEYVSKTTKGQQPHILLHIASYQNYGYIWNRSLEGQYHIVRSVRPYSKYNDGKTKLFNQNFEIKFNCNIEEIKGSNPGKYQELVCRKGPFIVPFQMVYQVLRCSSIVFSGATLLVFILLPPLRTMKTTIILCQTLSYLIKDLMDLRSSLGGWQPTYTECIAVGYSLHYWDLVASFWGSIMSIDLALTFRGRGFSRGKSRKTILLYSLYGWGGPLIIIVVTAILGFGVTLPDGFVKPDINLEHCWFHTKEGSLMYHYLPAMILSAVNIPLLGYTVYNIIKSVCASNVLRNGDSARHVGNKVKKESRTRLILYFNLALLIGSPKSLQYIKLFFTGNEELVLVLNTTGLLRAICMFLFVACKKKVFKLLKKRLLFESFSFSSVLTSLSSKSYDINSTDVSKPVPQETTRL